jgi:hypothetical protein
LGAQFDAEAQPRTASQLDFPQQCFAEEVNAADAAPEKLHAARTHRATSLNYAFLALGRRILLELKQLDWQLTERRIPLKVELGLLARWKTVIDLLMFRSHQLG